MIRSEEIRAEEDFERLTNIIIRWNENDKLAEQQLYSFAYQKFQVLASNVRKNSVGEISENTLFDISCNTTSLVHEAFIKINQSRDIAPESTKELYTIFSKVIYSILVDSLRKASAIKRKKNEAECVVDTSLDKIYRIIDIEIILKKLSAEYSRQVSVFIYKYVCSLSNKEIATLFSISDSTVDKDLFFIKSRINDYSFN
ncbi:ECF-type sigma factor [Shewanella sp. SM74]|uniref:ECF-type sigma factor n=1 Tax=Shewanella sp. SM74 TaxID=2912807 RepID=UPI0021D9ED0B|nr:ECF-type sigma factor [Shewanella sp. SM74]MCU8012013.1 ECF-type sigma factor [Shewanella sp. SM74]